MAGRCLGGTARWPGWEREERGSSVVPLLASALPTPIAGIAPSFPGADEATCEENKAKTGWRLLLGLTGQPGPSQEGAPKARMSWDNPVGAGPCLGFLS